MRIFFEAIFLIAFVIIISVPLYFISLLFAFYAIVDVAFENIIKPEYIIEVKK